MAVISQPGQLARVMREAMAAVPYMES